MKKLPLGLQSFKKIIEGNCVYVDKTQYIYNLINDASYYFLSRPRRFGKSLLLDTIAEAFGGDKELFKGLWIYNSDYIFKKHPVVRVDMSNMANKTPDALEASLSFLLKMYYAVEGFTYEESIASNNFWKLIFLLYNKYNERVVVLIDEYDKPILDHIDDTKIADGNRKTLSGFYGVLKSMDPYLRFTFITGITKFSKTSIFSELNNLKDITMSKNYAGICGIPTGSLNEYFGEYITELETQSGLKRCGGITEEIMEWYDGYSWDGRTKLLNPFSLLNFFSDKQIGGYWFATGTPGFLYDILKKKPESYVALKNLRITEPVLNNFNIERIEIEPLLFQTGYLTVTEVEDTRSMPIYTLDIPNNEVRDAFSMQILSVLTESGNVRASQAQMEISGALESGDLQKMLEIMRRLFASIPYELHVKEEAYYHSIFYAVMTMLGFDIDAEVSTSGGRIDAVLELENKVYVMEFKYVNCPKNAGDEDKRALFEAAMAAAMDQIHERGYCDKFIGSGKSIYKAAFAFLGRDEIEMRVEII